MNISEKLAHRFSKNSYVTALSLIASFASFGFVMRDVLSDATPKISSIIVLIAALLFFAVVNFYSLRIHNNRQRRINIS